MDKEEILKKRFRELLEDRWLAALNHELYSLKTTRPYFFMVDGDHLQFAYYPDDAYEIKRAENMRDDYLRANYSELIIEKYPENQGMDING